MGTENSGVTASSNEQFLIEAGVHTAVAVAGVACLLFALTVLIKNGKNFALIFVFFSSLFLVATEVVRSVASFEGVCSYIAASDYMCTSLIDKSGRAECSEGKLYYVLREVTEGFVVPLACLAALSLVYEGNTAPWLKENIVAKVVIHILLVAVTTAYIISALLVGLDVCDADSCPYLIISSESLSPVGSGEVPLILVVAVIAAVIIPIAVSAIHFLRTAYMGEAKLGSNLPRRIEKRGVNYLILPWAFALFGCVLYFVRIFFPIPCPFNDLITKVGEVILMASLAVECMWRMEDGRDEKDESARSKSAGTPRHHHQPTSNGGGRGHRDPPLLDDEEGVEMDAVSAGVNAFGGRSKRMTKYQAYGRLSSRHGDAPSTPNIGDVSSPYRASLLDE